MNSCYFTGNLGADIEVRYFPSGDPVGNVNLGVTERWKDRDSGDRKEHTEWIPLVFTGGLVDVMSQYTRKGSKIAVRGKWRTRSWESDGVKKYRTELRVEEMELLGDPRGGDDGGGQQGGASRGQQRPQGNRQHQPDQRGNARQQGNQGAYTGGYGSHRGGQQPRQQRAPSNGFEDMDDDIPF